ncbi:MAG: HEPN domain-containing protein [Anaerolineae bacterium]|nr:HEPN domain-containing protein [Anaerolineae bacterium]
MTKQELKIFLDIPDDLDETWTHVALFGGMVDGAHDFYSLANNFKQAGDVLIQRGLGNLEAYELLYPVLFNYRHAIELYLKAILKSQEKIHDLAKLMKQFKKFVKENYGEDVPAWFEKLILEFNSYDPGATTFRYPGRTAAPEERMVNLPELQKIMEILSETFHRVFHAKKKTKTTL